MQSKPDWPKEPRGFLRVATTKICPFLWKVWCASVLLPKTPAHRQESLHLFVTPSFSSMTEVKISLSCYVRQEHVLWGHFTTRYTSLTSTSPPTSSHLEPVTWTMQQIDLLISYHSSTIFTSEKTQNTDAEWLRNFQENSCWISLSVRQFWTSSHHSLHLISLKWLEMKC